MWKNWRDQARRSGMLLTPEIEARYTRREAAYDQAVKTFGNHEAAGMWLLRRGNELGEWVTPDDVAASSEDGLASVLAVLAKKAEEIGPVEVKPEVACGKKPRPRRAR